MPAIDRAQLDKWTAKRLTPPFEVRVKSGSSKDTLEAIGAISSETSADVTGDILELVEEAGLGQYVRLYARHPSTGKQMATRMFSPGVGKGTEARPAAPDLSSPEAALAYTVLVMERCLDRTHASNERLVTGLREPLTAMASLFHGEEQRRAAAEHKREAALDRLREMERIAEEVLSASEAESTPASSAESPLAGAAADFLRELKDSLSGSPKDKTPTPTPKSWEPPPPE